MGIRNKRAAALPAKLSRSWLLVNAMRTELFEPALMSDSDSVIYDLEASVPEDRKDEARENVVRALSSGMPAWVRVNAMNTEHWAKDLDALDAVEGLRGIVLPETERPEQVTLTAMRLHAGVPVIALIESARGIERATDIALAPGTFRLAFGTNDFRKDTGVSDSPLALAYARGKLVVASRVGKLPGAIDGPPPVTDTSEEARLGSRATVEMGMTGRLCLSVDHVDAINTALSPSDDERRWAKDMIARHEAGEEIGDGSYLPRLKRAQKIAALADSYGLWKD